MSTINPTFVIAIINSYNVRQMGTLKTIRLYKLHDLVRASSCSTDSVRVAPLMEGNKPFVFRRDLLHRYRSMVASMLSQLPDCMMQSSGMFSVPWIQAVRDWSGATWAFQLTDADLLLAMGRALQMVSVHVPDYPCTLPYVQILDVEASRNERLSLRCNTRLSRWDYGYLRVPVPSSSVNEKHTAVLVSPCIELNQIRYN